MAVINTVPGKGTLTLASGAVSVAVAELIESPARGVLTLTGKVLGAQLLIISRPGKGSLTLTGKIADVDNVRFDLQPGKGSLTLTGKAPLSKITRVVQPGTGTLVLTGKLIDVDFSVDIDGDAQLPAIETEGTLHTGSGFAGNTELAPIEADITFGFRGVLVLADVEAEGTLDTGRVFSGTCVLPAITVDGTASIRGVFSGDADIASIRATGSLLVGSLFSGTWVLPGILGSGDVFQRIRFNADVELTAIDVPGATLLVGSYFAGEAEITALEVLGAYTNATVLTYLGLSTNTFNRGHGEYSNVNFDGLGRLGTNTYAAMSDGLYRLNGEDDAGTAIEAQFILGFEDFGNEAVKAQRVAYAGMYSDGPMELLVRTDTDGDDFFSYTLELPHTSFAARAAPARVKLGRRLRGRYWQMGMRNLDGSDFNVDRLGLGVWSSTRKR